MRTKLCKKCNKKKSLTLFNDDFCSKDGYTLWCRNCIKKHKKIKVPSEIQELHNRKKEYREKVNKIKSDIGCTHCGRETNPIVLEFHHVDPEEKVDTITNLIKYGYEWEVIEAEIAKCEVVCSNCHKKFHRTYDDTNIEGD